MYRPGAWWEPSSAESRYSSRLDSLLSGELYQRVLQLLPALARLLTTYPRLPGRRPALPPHAALELVRFAVLGLELVVWVEGGQVSRPGTTATTAQCLQIAGLTFSNPHLAAVLSLPAHTSWAASAALALVSHATMSTGDTLPDLPYTALTEAVSAPAPQPALVAAAALARVLARVEEASLAADPLPSRLAAAFPALICLARLPQFSPLCRAPPLAFSLGWQPGLDLQDWPALPEQLLQEVEVLRQLVWRLNRLGWTGRAQFEETWSVV